MIDKEKLENVDPEVKEIMERLSEFVYPKFEELQTLLLTGSKKPGLMKMLKIAKEFTENLKKEYLEKYNRNLDEDIKMVNKNLDIKASPVDILNMIKNK